MVYARARIPVYWIINVLERVLEVYEEPSGSGDDADYRRHRDYGPSKSVAIVIDGSEVGRVAVGDLLP